jgi:hypothetical protein
MCLCVYVCVRMYVYVCACICAGVRVYARVRDRGVLCYLQRDNFGDGQTRELHGRCFFA